MEEDETWFNYRDMQDDTGCPITIILATTSDDYGTLSCPAFQTLSMLPCWRSIMFVSRHFLPSLLLLMLPISSGYISPPVQCRSTTPSESLRICSIGSHIALASIGVLVLGSPIFCRFWFHFPSLFGNPLGIAWCFFLDPRMGGVQSVRDPIVA